MKENEVLKAIRGRRSVIRFSDASVSEEQLEAILEAGRWAPVLLVVAVDAGKDPRHHIEDGAAAGKGSPEEELRSLLLLPRGHRLVAALPAGFPAYEAKASRRTLGEIVHTDRFAGGALAAR